MSQAPIALDAMGGDLAPQETVKGAVMAAEDFGLEVVVVGDKERLEAELDKFGRKARKKVTIRHASETVLMSDAPSVVIRGKRNSSIRVAARLVHDGEAAGLFSAGNTGATMASARSEFGLVKGVQRAAIAQLIPNRKEGSVILDLGANVDCKIEHLVQFGVMGSVYASIVLRKDEPKVGLLGIGTEDTKGNEFTKQVLRSLRSNESINFVGNVEGRDVFRGEVDVVVCDGFVGNIVLKITEGVAETVIDILRDSLLSSYLGQLGGLLIKPTMKKLKRKMDYTEYGGAILLGVNGVCLIGHGGSCAKAVRNGLRKVADSANRGIVGQIARMMAASRN